MVQAEARVDDELAELAWIASLASSEPALVGMVVFAPVKIGSGVRDLVSRLAAIPPAVGIRRLIQDEGVGFALTPGFIDGVRAALPPPCLGVVRTRSVHVRQRLASGDCDDRLPALVRSRE
jgi:hypothetical protein